MRFNFVGDVIMRYLAPQLATIAAYSSSFKICGFRDGIPKLVAFIFECQCTMHVRPSPTVPAVFMFFILKIIRESFSCQIVISDFESEVFLE